MLQSAERDLSSVSASPRLDAEVLFAHASGFPRWKVLTESRSAVESRVAELFRSLIERRKAHEPVAYITGEKEFWGLSFAVHPAVLIPRPETELIVSLAVEHARTRKDPVRVVDLGTGSGCIAVAISHELKALGRVAECVAVDASVDALEVARANAQRNGVENSIRFTVGDWFSVAGGIGGPFDIVAANPPYVARGEDVSPETRFEPQTALWADDDGLADVKRIVTEAPNHMADDGILLCEVGARKRSLLTSWLKALAAPVRWELRGDESADDRFAILRLWKA
jgi:release factor glutamine methyltransferase